MQIDRLDHLVLTVADLEKTVRFYVEALGMEHQVFGQGRNALRFGNQKINLHVVGRELDPKAARPTAGSGDLCFVSRGPLSGAIEHLSRRGVAIELGPVARTGALGPMTSVYVRDPDGNLVEIASYEG